MSHHPLIGHTVRVSPGLPPRITDRSFDGIVVDLLPEGYTLVMCLDDGTVKAWGPEAVRFADPERAARVLRAHAATTEAQGLGFKVEPEYTPPRWRHARDCGVGMSVLAIAFENGHVEMRPWGEPWFPEDAEELADDGLADTTMLLVGKLPQPPKETT